MVEKGRHSKKREKTRRNETLSDAKSVMTLDLKRTSADTGEHAMLEE